MGSFSDTLPLSLLVARIFAENSHHSFAPNHLTLCTDWLDRRSHFHSQFTLLLKPIGDPTARQIIGRQLYGHLVARKNTDKMHTHFA